MRNHTQQSGFSLIELLVVITVITVLVGFILPALADSRAEDRLLSWAANARSVGQGLVHYAGQVCETFPFGRVDDAP